MKIGLYEKAISNQFDWKQKIQLAKDANFDFIELSIDESDQRLARLDWSKEKWLELKQLLKAANLSFQSMCLSGHRKYALGSNNPVIENEGLNIFKKALKVCQLMDIKYIQLAGYDVYYEQSNDQTKQRFLKNLKIITKLAQDAKIILGIEIMDTPFMGTAKRVAEYTNKVNSDYLKIYPDLGNMFQWNQTEEQTIKDIQEYAHDFVQMHIKATKPNVFRDLPWDQSTVPYVSLLKTLKACEYNKDFVIETWAKPNVDYTYEQQLNELIFNYNFVVNKLKEAGFNVC